MNDFGSPEGENANVQHSEWSIGGLIDIETPVNIIKNEYERRKFAEILTAEEEEDFQVRILKKKTLSENLESLNNKEVANIELKNVEYNIKEEVQEEENLFSPFEASPKDILEEVEQKFRSLKEKEILLKIGDVFSCITPNHIIKRPLSLILMFDTEDGLNIFPTEGSRVTYIEPVGEKVICHELYYSGVSFTLPENDNFLIVFNKKP